MRSRAFAPLYLAVIAIAMVGWLWTLAKGIVWALI
jgi:hypothetical protein